MVNLHKNYAVLMPVPADHWQKHGLSSLFPNMTET